jgi:ubiquinone/menaquinone biosynthesis C-methylase UbiE
MNIDKKFDTSCIEKLNSNDRIKMIPPEKIWNELELSPANVLLDLGAGTGIFAKEFSKKLNSGKIYACDTNKVMVDWMQQNLVEKNIIPILSTENSIDFENESIDCVYMIAVYHELDEPLELLKEAYRLIKQGGKIAIIDWKKEKMEYGPKSIEIRASVEEIEKALISSNFRDVTTKSQDTFKYHSFVFATK